MNPIEVAIAVVTKGPSLLVALRHRDVHLGGAWEFPGGKCERGESVEAAALRELREECGIEAAAKSRLPAVTHDYGDRVVRITPVLCTWVSGEPHPLGCADCRWITLDDLRDLPMPAANDRIVDLVRRAISQAGGPCAG